MDEHQLKCVVEALLLSSQVPLTLDQIAGVFDAWQKPTQEELIQVIERLKEDYQTRAIEIQQVASGYTVQTKKQYSAWVVRMQTEKPAKYSRALLETLAIIAYKQPLTRAAIEEVRGVAVSSQIMRTLMDREWIRIVAYKDVPGKPAVYATTKEFLNYFNLRHLDDLPLLSTTTHEE